MSRTSLFLTRAAWVFLLVAFFRIPAGAQTAGMSQARTAGAILVVRVTGEAYAIVPGDTLRMPLKTGSLVLAGQIIVTGKNASVMLVLSNGATVTVAGDSVLAVEEFMQQPFAGAFRVTQLSKEPTSSTTRLHLVKGEIVSEVKKLNKEGGSSFSIRTPIGMAGIRGTAFRMTFLNDGGRGTFDLVMLEGEIEMRFTGRTAPVVVPQGRQLRIGNISIDPATGEAKLPEDGDAAVVDASAAGRAAVAQAVQALTANAAAGPLPVPAGNGPAADGADRSQPQEGGQEGAEQGRSNAGAAAPPPPPPSPGAQVPPPRLSPTDGE